ncbi:DUF1835 domain-containing protein [Tepidibacter hydrothermalis]|uniref:DUF1835 domain-containing protein n=1 Tax=Tepidibacter hydrothermalis TaxID=3036126 RepID=A0ABY8EE77_9FIRM|nr:DUF1835 domain-containing protein [Tepidibacter hydrothermalis]WFD10195.1 DUF1835 domain-containing protein [Tepidibacter hydrothermalis]
MSKFVHITFGDSAAGTLKYFFKTNKNEFNGEIINFREDYSIGPIYEIDTEIGLKKRIEYFEKIFNKISVDEYYEDIEKEFIHTYKSIKDIDPDSKVVIWYGKNTNDQVGLSYLSSLLRNKNLYEVNVSDSYITSYNENGYNPRAFGECAPEEISHLILTMKKLEKEKCNFLINDWEDLRKSKENLRILKDNKIIGVDESYYDNDILSNCTFNFKKAARIIGATMGKSDQLIGDTYIDYRVRALIESEQVEYRGKLETMRDFEIRVSGSVSDFFEKLFKKSCQIDEDGFYHYLIEKKENEIVVDTTYIADWNTIDLSNKLILDCDENNMFSLIWFKEGRDLVSINHILIDNIEYRIEMHEDENGKEIKTEAIILISDHLIDKQLEIQIKPYISIALKNQLPM